MWGEGGDHYRRLLNLGHIFFKKGYDTIAIHSPLKMQKEPHERESKGNVKQKTM